MDVNGTRFWQIADAAGFGLAGGTEAGLAEGLHWDAGARRLRLDRQQNAPVLSEDPVFAQAMALRPAPVADGGESYAWWDAASGSLRAGGFAPGSVPIELPADDPPAVPQPTDLAFGDDDILYVARNGAVLLLDRRERFRPARAALAGFAAQRLAPRPGGGAWVLDRARGRIAVLRGVPLRAQGTGVADAARFAPVEPNPDPPRMRRLTAMLEEDARAVDIAASPGGRLAVLAWRTADDAVVFTLEGRALRRRAVLAGLRFPYALAWVGEDRVAVLASDGAAPARQAFVYELDDASETRRPEGRIFPLIRPWHGGFCKRLAEVPSYPVAGATTDEPGGLRRLHALSAATHARVGRVTLGPFDAGRAGTVWHRLNAEALLPARTGLRVWAHADDTGAVPPPPGAEDAPAWAPHAFGAAARADVPGAPLAAWCDEASEVAFDPGLLGCPRAPETAGLFTVLLQQGGRAVRRVQGRWLWLHLELIGDGLATPEVAALRVQGARFSYRDRYLPGLYHETLSGPDAAAAGAASPPDFLERLLGLFEGPLTTLEGRIAASWLLTDPASAPEAALPWLASWVGVAAPAGTAPAALRQALAAAPWTARLNGTLGGLNAALELATGGVLLRGGTLEGGGAVPRPGQIALATVDGVTLRALVLGVQDPAGGAGSAVLVGGAVSRGEIVVVEGWRLRRSFATILGADLADGSDPLTLGLAASGNSVVGDSLILGEAARAEALALFGDELPRRRGERAAVAAFFERLAHRVLVLARATPRTRERARLAEVARAASPAHVETEFHIARQALIVGAASLVGVDTFLLDEPPPRRARLGRSALGAGDRVGGEGRLDARADGPVTAPPRAVAEGPGQVFSGRGFVLSAARSSAAGGRGIARNIWTWV